MKISVPYEVDSNKKKKGHLTLDGKGFPILIDLHHYIVVIKISSERS